MITRNQSSFCPSRVGPNGLFGSITTRVGEGLPATSKKVANLFDLASSLTRTIEQRRITMLGVGPMSITVTREAVTLANHYKTPISLIPSRRQVDSAELGGGYVEGWSTAAFSKFVKEIDIGGYALLARDHSGPWQGSASAASSSFPLAMEDAKKSLEDDIACGFNLLHIDPSPALNKGFSERDVTAMAVELIAHCVSKMSDSRQCAFEVGTDEQDTAPDPLRVTAGRITTLLRELDRFGLPKPLFYVAQTGTKVLETRNFGSFDQPFTVEGSLPATVFLPEVLGLLKANGLLLKEHNADYLSDKSLRWHRKFGIHGANVAPEFGVVETKALLALLREHRFEDELEQFSRIVLEGAQWAKWLRSPTVTEDDLKVAIAGHYHFADPRVIEIRDRLSAHTSAKGADSESIIAAEVRRGIERYLMAFGYEAA